MPYDALTMKAVTDELQNILPGALIQNIFEPDDLEIVIHFYHRSRQINLLLSVNPAHARIHLTKQRKKGKTHPSSFCMLLRKYLIGGRIKQLDNPLMERILAVTFSPPAGIPPVRLMAEIMGRRSNLILVDDQEIILGALKTASAERNPIRPIFPGESYRPVPSPQGKLNPLEMSAGDLHVALEGEFNNDNNLSTLIRSKIMGISPVLAEELAYRLRDKNRGLLSLSEQLYHEIENLFQENNPTALKPTYLPERALYAAIPLTHLQEYRQIEYGSFNEMLDEIYQKQIREEQQNHLRKQLSGAVEKRLAILKNKLHRQKKELSASTRASEYRLYGETLLTYGDRVTGGSVEAVLPHLYEADKEIVIPLDPSLSAIANAQRYFRRYRKARQGFNKIQKQIRKTRNEMEYCRELIYTIDRTTGTSLDEIREELLEAGYLKKSKKTKPHSKGLEKPQPLVFQTTSGRTILVGRNNRQNDYITFRSAVRRDTWFHVRGMPGSHVILKEVSYPPPQEDIEEAAFLAAYFSKGQESGAVEVDYTEIRHVRRQPGGKPGSVFYENYETITINPLDRNFRKRFNLA
ncbi:MAG: NFACT family protein [Bacillota bacterium]|nr:NFACT family protein [Bacillota bacterium]